jgi:predicted RNA-binding Zn-ribbon protein involved in translation (DUF1610 family)
MSETPPIVRDPKRCDECDSIYFADSSALAQLCPECAHHLYGYANCDHAFAERRCVRCGWDGSRSAYLRSKLGEHRR